MSLRCEMRLILNTIACLPAEFGVCGVFVTVAVAVVMCLLSHFQFVRRNDI